MPRTRWILCSLAVLSLLAITAFAASSAFAQAKQKGGDLQSHMEAMQADEQKLKSIIDKPDKSKECLEIICDMEKHSFEAKLLEPSHAQKLPGKDKDKILKAFRVRLLDLERELRTTEQALVNGDGGAAVASFRKVQEIEKSGHAQFRKKGS